MKNTTSQVAIMIARVTAGRRVNFASSGLSFLPRVRRRSTASSARDHNKRMTAENVGLSGGTSTDSPSRLVRWTR